MRALVRLFTNKSDIIDQATKLIDNLNIEMHIIDEAFRTKTYTPFFEAAQRADIAILVFDGDTFSKIIESEKDLSIQNNAIFESGLLAGIFSMKKTCLMITNTDNHLPAFFSAFTKFNINHLGISKKRFALWLDNIESSEVSVFTPPKISHIVSLETALSTVFKEKKEFDSIRVFALSTNKSADILMKSGIRIKKATLLLREYTIVDEFLQLSMEGSINKSVEQWKRMSESSVINELQILRYDFHPTTGFYIFDNRYIILGNVYFDIKKGEYSFDNKEVFLIDSYSDLGKQFINKCISHFDKLAEIYSDFTV